MPIKSKKEKDMELLIEMLQEELDRLKKSKYSFNHEYDTQMATLFAVASGSMPSLPVSEAFDIIRNMLIR